MQFSRRGQLEVVQLDRRRSTDFPSVWGRLDPAWRRDRSDSSVLLYRLPFFLPFFPLPSSSLLQSPDLPPGGALLPANPTVLSEAWPVALMWSKSLVREANPCLQMLHFWKWATRKGKEISEDTTLRVIRLKETYLWISSAC